MIQSPVAAGDTFPHMADSLVRGVAATLPGGPKVSAILVILAVVLVNAVLIYGAARGFRLAGGIKGYLADFPSHNAATALALVVFFETALIVLIRLALGLIFPEGYDTWIWALVGMAGVNVAGLIGKRATDWGYVKAKAGSPAVTVEGDATINTTAERKAAANVAAEDGAVG